jgi:hypothetical protein
VAVVYGETLKLALTLKWRHGTTRPRLDAIKEFAARNDDFAHA